MARDASSNGYLADSEASTLDYEYSSEHGCFRPRGPRAMNVNHNKPHKSRRVTVKTPSEEDLYRENRRHSHSHRPSTPFPTSRHSSCSDQQEPFSHQQNQNHNRSTPATAPDNATPSTATATATPVATAAPGVQSYNNPACSAAPLGPNQVYVHGSANPNNNNFPAGQIYVINTAQRNAPNVHDANVPGQPGQVFFTDGPNTIANMPQQLGGYQNAAPVNPGALNFQPQTPDTTYGPYHHTYVPRFDGGSGTYVVQPGIGSAAVYTAPVMPATVYTQQPQPGQPMMMPMPGSNGGYPPGPPVIVATGFSGYGGGPPPPGGQPVLVNGGPAPIMPGTYPPPGYQAFHPEPATGIGQTASEVANAWMTNPQLNEAQDFKPADDDPSRMYMVRQLDGQYIQMPRITIDSLGKRARWYVQDDGVFYAVRLE